MLPNFQLVNHTCCKEILSQKELYDQFYKFCKNKIMKMKTLYDACWSLWFESNFLELKSRILISKPNGYQSIPLYALSRNSV